GGSVPARAGLGVGRLLVVLVGERLARGDARLGGVLHRVDVVAAERLLQGRERALHLVLLVARDLVAVLTEHLLGGVDERVRVVADLGLVAASTILLGVRFGVA